jgi:hypothetical protein
MKIIALIAVLGVLLLQATGSIPLASVGGSLVIGFAFIAAALAAGIHEAWTQQRGVVGWAVNLVVSFLGALVGAQVGGMAMVILLYSGGHLLGVPMERSLAATGGAVMTLALIGGMLATLFGAWGAVQIVNRWR